jgi:hypothetical protein
MDMSSLSKPTTPCRPLRIHPGNDHTVDCSYTDAEVKDAAIAWWAEHEERCDKHGNTLGRLPRSRQTIATSGRPLFVFVVGAPATGKSSTVQAFMAKTYSNKGYAVVDKDALLAWSTTFQAERSTEAADKCRTLTKAFSNEILQYGWRHALTMVYVGTGKNLQSSKTRLQTVPADYQTHLLYVTCRETIRRDRHSARISSESHPAAHVSCSSEVCGIIDKNVTELRRQLGLRYDHWDNNGRHCAVHWGRRTVLVPVSGPTGPKRTPPSPPKLRLPRRWWFRWPRARSKVHDGGE